MSSRYANALDYLWILLVALFLYPVLTHTGHGDATVPVEQGPLLLGISSLDSLLEDSWGRPVLMNFWATWCSPCVGELPHLDNIYRSMDGRAAVIAVDIGDPRLETLLGFREEFKLSMPVVWLGESDVEELKARWELPDVLPVSIVLDDSGTETVRAAGVRDEAFFMAALEGNLPRDTLSSGAGDELHINLVGSPEDPMTAALLEASVELAGEDHVDLFDPSIPSDSLSMVDLRLPFTGFAYAQPCVGSACGRLARTPEDLVLVVGSLSN